MIEIYNNQVGAENVLQTWVEGTMRLEVEADGTARLVTDDALTYDRYGWDDDDDGGGGGTQEVAGSSPASSITNRRRLERRLTSSVVVPWTTCRAWSHSRS
jgi:hypothetical protein